MAMVNRLTVLAACPNCGEQELRRVQFRFGYVRQFRYVIGSRLEWESVGSIGLPGLARVVADAALDTCSNCNDDRDCAVLIHNDVLVGVDFEPDPQPPEDGWYELERVLT
jgi:hypothetical protein